MRQRAKRKLQATAKAVLNVLDKQMGWMFVMSKRESLRRLRKASEVSFGDEFWEEYYASTVRDRIGKLERKGQVEVKETETGTEVKITNKGRTEVLKYKLQDLVLEKPQKWDGKWRMVFFDVAELERRKRDDLRRWLVRLGLKPMQKSVWVHPYPLEKEVKFLREVVGVPHGVKLVTAETIENDEELRELFDL